MREFKLLTLKLHAPLCYSGIENPPFIGLAVPEAFSRLSGTPSPKEGEGREEIFVFDEVELVSFDPDDGPRAAARPPAPRFYGSSLARGAKGKEGEAPCALDPGLYLFMQWRPSNEAEFREGVEWFAREAWWEGEAARGPYIVRRLVEDGKVATQLFRALPAAAKEGE